LVALGLILFGLYRYRGRGSVVHGKQNKVSHLSQEGPQQQLCEPGSASKVWQDSVGEKATEEEKDTASVEDNKDLGKEVVFTDCTVDGEDKKVENEVDDDDDDDDDEKNNNKVVDFNGLREMDSVQRQGLRDCAKEHITRQALTTTVTQTHTPLAAISSSRVAEATTDDLSDYEISSMDSDDELVII
jgi:hypothetical protein